MNIEQAFLTLCLHDWKSLPLEARQRHKFAKSKFLKHRNNGPVKNKIGESTMRELLLLAGYRENWEVKENPR